MKKVLITLLAALFVSGAFAQDTAFPDIPANHWAGDAVARIADLGIVIGFPDGTFRGNESFTRYQAALVISRLLDVVNAEFDARMAMSEEDMASLRNALQELASDVAAQGVRLAAAESAVASLSDDVTANASRIDDLESQMMGMDTGDGMDPAVLQELQNQIASLRVGLDTAQAQAEAAEARANEAFDLANQALTQARENANQIAAANEALNLLADELRNRGVDIDLSGLDTLGDRIGRAESDIANIREFVILLRRDQVALRDRVAALEASDAEQAAAIDDLLGRVTALEENPLGLSGEIALEYYVGRTIGGFVFDVDRVYGLNNERDMGDSTFSSGTEDLNDDDDDTDVGEVVQDRGDIDPASGDVSVDLSLSIGVGSVFNGDGSPNALNSFEAVIELSIVRTDTVLLDEDGDPLENPFIFEVGEVTTTFDPIGSAPLTFSFGEEVTADFTPYILDVENDGFVATIGAPDFLAFLDPTLEAVYAATDTDTYLRAGRITLSPLDGFTIGGSFAQEASNAGDKDDVAGDNVETTIFGVDGQISLSIFDLNVEWANSDTSGDVVFAELDIDASGLPILDSLSANYRDIAGDWDSGNPDSLDGDDDDYPFEIDQAGFAVEAGLGLFILDLDAYFDQYTVGDPDAPFAGVTDTSAFGVDAAADLFAGFSLTAFYHQVSIDGAVVDDNEPTERDNEYDTGFGVGLVHDGDADNALIDNLNLEFAYEQLGEGFDETHILAAADYELMISILTLTPYVSYESFNDADAGSDDTAEIKAGTGLSTDPLGVFLAPSLEAAVNYRSNSHTDTGAGDYTSTELQWSVGVMLNEFLFDHSTLSVSYGSYTGENMTLATSDDDATDISDGDANNGSTQSTSGYEIVWDYYDLEFAYGVYQNEITGAGAADRSGSAQAFRISYTVTF